MLLKLNALAIEKDLLSPTPSRKNADIEHFYHYRKVSSRSLDPINRTSQTDGDFFSEDKVKRRGGANGAEADKSLSIQQQMAPSVISLAFRRGEKGKRKLEL